MLSDFSVRDSPLLRTKSQQHFPAVHWPSGEGNAAVFVSGCVFPSARCGFAGHVFRCDRHALGGATGGRAVLSADGGDLYGIPGRLLPDERLRRENEGGCGKVE